MADVEPRDGFLSVRRTDDEAALIEYAAMLRVDFGAEVEAWPADQVPRCCAVHIIFRACITPRRFTSIRSTMRSGLRPMRKNTARGFLKIRVRDRDRSGGRAEARADFPRRRARASRRARRQHRAGVADASIGTTVLPVSTYVAVTAPLGEKLFDAVRYTGAVADTRRAGDYYRIVADDRLLWGGRIT